ncbi:MAG TPA: glycosyltransferase family 39 protein, partial [Tepidisphaeraceae bacterium]|nr:glycosyltransferase family 39 protein [Tepidisphaeraceae bacterium]
MISPAISTRKRYRLSIALILLCAAIVYLTGLDHAPLVDRDEPRYAQTSRQMVQTNDWIVPRFLDEVRTAKPVLIYWVQAGTMRVLGDTVFAARLPSAIAMMLTLGLLAFVLPHVVGRTRSAWTVFVLSSCVMVFWSAKTCLTDAVLLLWITIAQLCLYAAWRGRANWGVVACWAIVTGLAVLTKGPVIFGVQGATLILLWIFGRKPLMRPSPIVSMSISNLLESAFARVALFTIILCAIAGPWLFLVTQREPTFLSRSITHDVIGRATSALENHW